MIPSFSKCTHKGKVQGERRSRGVEGFPGAASLRLYREGPGRGGEGPDQGPDHRSPADPVLSRAAEPHLQAASEVGGDHAGVGGELGRNTHHISYAAPTCNAEARPPLRRLARKWFRRRAGFGKADYRSQNALRRASRGVPPRQISRGDNWAGSVSPNE